MTLSPKKKDQIYNLIHQEIVQLRKDLENDLLGGSYFKLIREKIDYKLIQLEIPLAQKVMKLLEPDTKTTKITKTIKKVKKIINPKFIIDHFPDYHFIQCDRQVEELGKKYIELGCFPTKGYSFFRYYGLFYDIKPTVEEVMVELDKKVIYDITIDTTEATLSRQDVFDIIRDILKEYL